MASSAFYNCESFHIPGIRRGKLGGKRDSEQKGEKEGIVKGGWEWNDLKKPLKEGKDHVSFFPICIVFDFVIYEIFYSFGYMERMYKFNSC